MDMIGWKEKALCRDMGDKVRGLGVALSMQGSGIANVDIASTVIKLQDDGFYTLSIGATDMGTGCDTILAQMAAECLDCDVDKYHNTVCGYGRISIRYRLLCFCNDLCNRHGSCENV